MIANQTSGTVFVRYILPILASSAASAAFLDTLPTRSSAPKEQTKNRLFKNKQSNDTRLAKISQYLPMIASNNPIGAEIYFGSLPSTYVSELGVKGERE